MEMQNALDFEDRHYKRKMENYEEQINTLYDELERIESVIDELEIRKEGIKKQAITVDNIYKCLVEFNSMYIKLTDEEKRAVIQVFIEAVHIYPEEQPNGQILKRIDFKFPVSYEGEDVSSLSWDKDGHVETVCLLSQHSSDKHIDAELGLDELT